MSRMSHLIRPSHCWKDHRDKQYRPRNPGSPHRRKRPLKPRFMRLGLHLEHPAYARLAEPYLAA